MIVGYPTQTNEKLTLKEKGYLIGLAAVFLLIIPYGIITILSYFLPGWIVPFFYILYMAFLAGYVISLVMSCMLPGS